VGSSADDRVWVRLIVSGESAYPLAQGDSVSFTGMVVGPPGRVLSTVGVEAAEGEVANNALRILLRGNGSGGRRSQRLEPSARGTHGYRWGGAATSSTMMLTSTSLRLAVRRSSVTSLRMVSATSGMFAP